MAGDSSALKLYWRRPASVHASRIHGDNGVPITDYVIVWGRVGDSSQLGNFTATPTALDSDRTDDGLFEYIISGLEPGVPIWTRVAAINSVGVGVWQERCVNLTDS